MHTKQLANNVRILVSKILCGLVYCICHAGPYANIYQSNFFLLLKNYVYWQDANC